MNEMPKLTRSQVPALDEILGQPFSVLDDGFVRVVDYMGSDSAVVQAARVSYGDGTKKVSDDRGLIRYLMRHRHTSPFEMCELKLHVRVPMDTWRQWIRHRTASVNEYSTRYSVAIDAMYTTQPEQWRQQASSNRQGSDGFVARDLGQNLSDEEQQLHLHARRVYQSRIEQGIAREQARKDLPLCTYTEAYWKIDLHNLLHFLALRCDPHAQAEIRAYADTIGQQIVARWVPLCWEAFSDFRLQATSLTRIEFAIIGHLARNEAELARTVAMQAGWLQPGRNGWRRHRERSECEEKLAALGLSPPWESDATPEPQGA